MNRATFSAVRTYLLLVAVLTGSCAGVSESAAPDGANQPIPVTDGTAGIDSGQADARAIVPNDGGHTSDLGHGKDTGKATFTYYWLAEQSDYTGAKDTALCDVHAKILATVPLAFARSLQIEGSGRLLDGRVLNIGGSCACSSGMSSCYIVLDTTKYPWGMGAGSRPLVPYRSTAVDPMHISLDTRLWVPELVGVTMPAAYGFVHDGCLDAVDTGGHIIAAHIDFFVAEKANYLTLDRMLKLSQVTVYTSPPGCL